MLGVQAWSQTGKMVVFSKLVSEPRALIAAATCLLGTAVYVSARRAAAKRYVRYNLALQMLN